MTKTKNTEEKEKQQVTLSINKIASIIEKKSGVPVLTGTQSRGLKVKTISTGSLLVDMASGVGGFPLRSIIEIFGAESSGKTTLAISAAANAQKDGKLVMFVDSEHAFDPDWAKTLGLDIDNTLILQPNSLEEGLEAVKAGILNGVNFIIFDSVAAAPTSAEIQGDIGDQVIGHKARIMSKSLSSFTPLVSNNDVILIFINQVRESIGTYGNPEVTPGGKALKFYSRMRLRLNKRPVTKGDEKIGDDVTVTFVKNKVAAPYKKTVIKLKYGEGFDRMYEIAVAAVELGLLKRSGSWLTFTDYDGKERKLQGVGNLETLLKEDEKMFDFIWEQVRKEMLERFGVEED